MLIIDYIINTLKEFAMISPEENSKTKYIYVGNRGFAHTNVITIAYTINLNNKLLFGASFSNYKDSYDKFYGKLLAEQRLHNQPYIIPLSLTDNNSHYKLINIIINRYLLGTDNVPTWAKSKLKIHIQLLNKYLYE